MAFRTRRIRGVSRQVRETMWISVAAANTSIASASTAVLVGSLNAAALALRPFTIVRVRGFIHLASDQEGSDENYSASIGYAVVSDQASAIGVTAVPTPETDRGSDLFFVHETLAGRFIFVSGLTAFETFPNRTFDSKAMRKVNDDSDMVIVLETSSVSSGVQFFDAARVLIKLH